ncbi:MAG TPA: sigma-70 family RNA polymerase sigma factor [Niabella sp.]|nr:sigma-70 family RNA polymerase sigma factor [Niabella sp.]
MKKELSDILYWQRRIAYFRDEKAYKELYFHFYTPLHRFAVTLLGDPETSEELVSDVMIRIWLMEEKLNNVNRLDLYLFKSVRNAALACINENRPVILHTGDASYLDRAGYFTADSKINTNEISSCIEAAVKRLPPQSRLVFRLVKDEGLSYKEVQSVMGISNNSIKTHIRIALKRIRLALEDFTNEASREKIK